jgi:hypothetical protein
MPRPAILINEAYITERITIVGECWIWNEGKSKDGYGTTRRKGKHWMAHRLAYTIFTGPIPEGKDILHQCDNSGCCNPLHLFPGTQLDNIRDKVQKGRQAKGAVHGLRLSGPKNAFFRKFGEESPSHRIPEALVRKIHSLATSLSHNEIAKETGVSRRHVSNILKGKYWPHIYEEIKV